MKSATRLGAILASLAAVLACGEPAQKAAQPTTNLEIYEAAHLEEPEISLEEELQAIQSMRRVWSKYQPVFRSHFLGIPTLQNPMDAWVIQEIISEVKPDLIVEAGTYKGGSAVLWAMILEHVNPAGRILTIDIEDQRTLRVKQLPIAKRKVQFLLGSSTDPDIVAEVRRKAEGKRVLVILDSLHTADHVAAELEAYAPRLRSGATSSSRTRQWGRSRPWRPSWLRTQTGRSTGAASGSA